jgi:glucose-fructose oxidoreductase
MANRRRAVVNYAVVGLGHIAQVAVLPAFANARRNSRLAAVVSGDRAKRKALASRYGLERSYAYEEYDECLRHVDAVYIAMPNSEHADYAIRAARAGVHVLCEKPLAVTARECERMIDACGSHGVKLMTAYRLHFEAINLGVIDQVRRGRIGEPRFFSSTFSMTVRRGDIRTKRAYGGGTVYDLGVYCINAARYLFRSEPSEVMAISTHGGGAALSEIDETTGAVLRFDGERVATFITSFNADDTASYHVVGTKGQIHVDPAFEYAEGLASTMKTRGGRTIRRRTVKRDQFAAELLHFSDCVLYDRTPEPSGLEGLQDVRIVEAIYASARTGRAVRIPPYVEATWPTGRQRIAKPGVARPRLIKVQSARVD